MSQGYEYHRYFQKLTQITKIKMLNVLTSNMKWLTCHIKQRPKYKYTPNEWKNI